MAKKTNWAALAIYGVAGYLVYENWPTVSAWFSSLVSPAAAAAPAVVPASAGTVVSTAPAVTVPTAPAGTVVTTPLPAAPPAGTVVSTPPPAGPPSTDYVLPGRPIFWLPPAPAPAPTPVQQQPINITPPAGGSLVHIIGPFTVAPPAPTTPPTPPATIRPVYGMPHYRSY